MKRIILAGILAIMTLLKTVSAFAMTREEDIQYEQIIKNLEEDAATNGGAYYDGDALHIVPLENTADLFQAETFSTGQTGKVVIDSPQQYSLEELENAFLTLRKHRDEFAIVGYTVSHKNNALVVGAPEWTEELKQAIRDLVQMDNVIFEIESDSVMSEDSSPTPFSKETVKDRFVRIGSEIQDIDYSGGTINTSIKGRKSSEIPCGSRYDLIEKKFHLDLA